MVDSPHRLDTEGSRDRGSCLGGNVKLSESTGRRKESASMKPLDVATALEARQLT